MNKKSIFLVSVLLVIVATGAFLLGKSEVSERAGKVVVASTLASKKEAGEPIYYRHPMNPEITSPVPAKGSMGMDYIPVFPNEGDNDQLAGTVRIDSVVQQNIGVRSRKAERKSLSHTVRAVGRITYDERRITQLHPKTEGWIEKLFVDTTGEQVEEDTILLSLYSPKLVASQQEYVLALKNFEMLKNNSVEDIRVGAEALVRSSRARLELFDVPEHQIHELERTLKPQKTLHIHSPAKGIVTQIGVRNGQHVTSMTQLYTIADLSKVWVYADIFEYELSWVQVGDEVDITVAALPGKTFSGQVAYIYPYAESKTRTVKIRIELDNPDLMLRPETFANIVVRTSIQEQATVIPSEAVIRSGAFNQVFIVRGEGRFEPRKVELGLQSDGQVIVLEGVQPGEEVVTSSQFLIDSESKLREAAAKMMSANSDKTP